MRSGSISLTFLFLLFSGLPARGETFRLGKAGSAASVTREHSVRPSDGSSVVKVGFHLRELRLKKKWHATEAYSAIAVDHLPLSSDPGLPALPFQAITVDASVSDLRVYPILGEAVSLKVGKLFPAQPEPCRCPELERKSRGFVDQVSQYKAPASGFLLQSLGDFRGQPLSRVLLFPHRYDPSTGVLQIYPNARFEISYRLKASSRGEGSYDFLVLSPRALAGGLDSWIEWKRNSQGLRFRTVIYEDIGSPNAEALKSWFHAEYARAGFRYALIVGGRSRVPQLLVETTTDRNTPSDLPYFTMGDSSDVVPDVYAGRVVSDNVDSLRRILRKWMEYERENGAPASGWRRVIGIASNEGSNPSDADYVSSIQARFQSAWGSESVYLFQNNSDSNPVNFNNQLNGGAAWVTYLGHGSGTSWPSFGQTYSVSHIPNLRNAASVKPVWIDVACLNGALEPQAAGARLASEVDPQGEPIGVAAYYGGTVLISWHPPAIFARGVAFKLADMARPILGEVIQAGQRYLTEQNSNLQDIASNQRWYHLQGDPSLRLRLK